jgi:hypothetical protein
VRHGPRISCPARLTTASLARLPGFATNWDAGTDLTSKMWYRPMFHERPWKVPPKLFTRSAQKKPRGKRKPKPGLRSPRGALVKGGLSHA